MIFNVISRKENLLEKFYEKSMQELKEFFGINWIYNKPKVFLVPNRKTINMLKDGDSPAWSVGWVNGKDVYLLDKNSFEKESSHAYSDEKYFFLMKHELAHAYT